MLWILIRLLLMEQSDLVPYCLQYRQKKADGNCHENGKRVKIISLLLVLKWRSSSKQLYHGWKFSGFFLNLEFWGWLSIESQPQNAEFCRLLCFDNLFYNSLNWKLMIFCRHNAQFEIWISKVQDFQILSFHLALLCSQLIFHRSWHYCDIIETSQTSIGRICLWRLLSAWWGGILCLSTITHR